jgi:hypothetical protein
MTIAITMNTGTTTVGTMAIGFPHHTDTIVVTSLRGIHGGGIGIGGEATGVTIGPGISSILDSMWYGTIMDAGGTDHAMETTYNIACLVIIIHSGRERGLMVFISPKNHRARSMYRTVRIKSGSLPDRMILSFLLGWKRNTVVVT